jgi:hypothetical protein
MWADMVGMGGGMVRDDGRGFLYRRSVFADNGVNPHRAIDGRVARYIVNAKPRPSSRPAGDVSHHVPGLRWVESRSR